MTLSTYPTNLRIEHHKIADYLLNEAHPVGGSKARFFLRFGFSLNDVPGMATALAGHAMVNYPGVEKISPEGVVTLVYEGPIHSPDGRNPKVRSIWTVNSPDVASFVTAYPCR